MDLRELILIALSQINFILAMIIVLLIASCFLGRNVKITRKMILSACFVIVFDVAVTMILDHYEDALMRWAEPIVTEPALAEAGYNAKVLVMLIESLIVNGVAFLFAFVFYLIAFKEHRFLRAIEATICLYGYYLYVQNMIQGCIVFLSGGTSEYLVEQVSDMDQLGFLYSATIIFDFVIDVILILILYLGYYRKHRRYILRVPFRILFVLWVILSSFLISLPMAESQIDANHLLLSISYGIIIPIVCIVAPVVIVTMASEKFLREQNEYQESYLKAELEYIEQYKRTQTETRAFRHDIINNLSLAKMMLDEGRTEDANAHISGLLGDVRALSPRYVTGDEMLDMIVSLKADKMRDEKIRFTCDGVLDGGLNMKPMDCCSIFANALDNAIEAARDSSDPFVDLSIKRTSKFFVIRISNSCREKVDINKLFAMNGYTSKSDKEHHGFGLSNIRNTAESYNGMVKAECEDDVFALSVMVPRDKAD